MRNKEFEGGQTVYTVNNKTNEVDEWIVAGVIPTENGRRYILARGKFRLVLPARCIFESRGQALAVANKKKF